MPYELNIKVNDDYVEIGGFETVSALVHWVKDHNLYECDPITHVHGTLFPVRLDKKIPDYDYGIELFHTFCKYGVSTFRIAEILETAGFNAEQRLEIYNRA